MTAIAFTPSSQRISCDNRNGYLAWPSSPAQLKSTSLTLPSFVIKIFGWRRSPNTRPWSWSSLSARWTSDCSVHCPSVYSSLCCKCVADVLHDNHENGPIWGPLFVETRWPIIQKCWRQALFRKHLVCPFPITLDKFDQWQLYSDLPLYTHEE